ncbi:MAG: tetratricopeptide repeat protein, partial [Methanobacteriota archaeon]
KARAHHVPVLLSTLVSNLKDQPPFIGHFSSTMDEMTRQQLEARLLVAKNHYISGDWKSALQELSQINQIDSSHAEVHFLLGRCYLQAGDSFKAYQHFSRARDLDELRFRAPSFFNRILKKVAKAEDVPLVDIEAVFRKASPEGIPGNELLHEHLHPNFDGYRLMAQTYLEALRTVQILNPPRPIRWDSTMLTPQKIGQIIEKFTLDSAGVTELDLEFGAVRNYILLNRWPFEGTDRQLRHYKPFHNAITKQLAIRHYRDKTYWDKSHYDLAEYYLERGLDYKAFREYRAVYFAFPDNYYPVMKMGDMMFRLQKFQQALNWYKQAQHLVPNNPHINAKLGNIFILMNDFPKALTYLNSAVQIDRQRKTFNKDERLNVLYLLAVTQANLLKFDEALNTIRE